MTHTIHFLIEQYGLFAVFLGCIAEGESVAILGGFFAHQKLFIPWQAWASAAGGAFMGDFLMFMAGRRFADYPRIQKLRDTPGFEHAFTLVEKHPNLFVLLNRYVYGFRAVGGVAAGLSNIPVYRFVILNGISSIVWASLFCGLGYIFGLGAEQIVGQALLRHEKLLVGLAIGLIAAGTGWFAAHHFAKKRRA